MADIDDKAAQIAAEAVGQARGAAPAACTVIGTLEEWVAEVETSVTKNPLLSVVIAAALGFSIAKLGRLR